MWNLLPLNVSLLQQRLLNLLREKDNFLFIFQGYSQSYSTKLLHGSVVTMGNLHQLWSTFSDFEKTSVAAKVQICKILILTSDFLTILCWWVLWPHELCHKNSLFFAQNYNMEENHPLKAVRFFEVTWQLSGKNAQILNFIALHITLKR